MNGVINFKGYTFWHNTNVVYDVIWKYLINKFPNSTIFPELFKIDFFMLNENIPVEIQSTMLGKVINKLSLSHSGFEQAIEKQITQNIQNYGSCYFFMDLEYLRYMQFEYQRNTRINLDWFYQFIKEKKLKVFIIDYKGIIKETTLDDFKFLGHISMTCEVCENKDFRILNKNKFKIMNNVLKGHGFSDDEVLEFKKEFDKVKGQNYMSWLSRREFSKRKKLFGSILRSIGYLNFINQSFTFTNNEKNFTKRNNKEHLLNLGLFKMNMQGVNATICFSDTFNIAQFFPGYIRNKDVWESLRNNYVTFLTLKKIMSKEIDVKDIDKEEIEIKYKKKEKIKEILLRKNGFTDDEIDEFRREFENNSKNGDIFRDWLKKFNSTKRQKLLGKIIVSTGNINLLNDFFERNNVNKKDFKRLKDTLSQLKIIVMIKGGINSKVEYIDKYKISDLFKGYEKNKEFWDSIKNKEFKYKNFWNLIYNKNNIPSLTKFLK